MTGGPAGSGWVAKRQDAAPSASDNSSTIVRTVTFVLCLWQPTDSGRATLRGDMIAKSLPNRLFEIRTPVLFHDGN